MKNLIVGVDEAGRGPLAGPVAVGVAMVSENFDWSLLPGVNDSKQLSESKREVIFLLAKQLKKAGKLDFAVAMVSARVIDRVGITTAVNCGIIRALRRLEKNTTIYRSKKNWDRKQLIVKLDGGLKAPKEFIYQETIIKGDSKEKVIGLASIMAKVTRDRYMAQKQAEPAFVPYNFATHKGYGTKAHRAAIKKHGLSPLHRSTFCTRIV